MTRQTKDLFDEKSMSFGEHLEELRWHLVRSILYLFVAFLVCLFWGGEVLDVVRTPIDQALAKYSLANVKDDTQGFKNWSDWWYNQFQLQYLFGERSSSTPTAAPVTEPVEEKLPKGTLRVSVPVTDLQSALQQARPDLFPPPDNPPPAAPPTEKTQEPETVSLLISSPDLAEMQAVVEQSRRAVTLKVEEAFTTYLQVAAIASFVLASPLVFREIWMFIAAGLYQHERRYVHIYGTMSLVLFLTGAVFCFYWVIPLVLEFLLSFNSYMKIQPQIRLSEWINFAIVLPVAFGVSFQLPLVMLFLDRLQVMTRESFIANRKMAILVISILSTFLTPPDPMSMILMMFPLIALYELGIMLCAWAPSRSPFDEGQTPAAAK